MLTLTAPPAAGGASCSRLLYKARTREKGGMITSKSDDIHCAETSDVQGRFDALRYIISDQDLVDTIYKDNKISTRFEDQSVGTLSRRIPKTLQAGDWPVVSPSGREERDGYPARSDEYIFIFGKDADGEELGKQEQRNQRQKGKTETIEGLFSTRPAEQRTLWITAER